MEVLIESMDTNERVEIAPWGTDEELHAIQI